MGAGSMIDVSSPLAQHSLNQPVYVCLRAMRQWKSPSVFRDLARHHDIALNGSPHIGGAISRGMDGSLLFVASDSPHDFGTMPNWPGFSKYTMMCRFRLTSTGAIGELSAADNVTNARRAFQFRVNATPNIEAIAFNTAPTAFTATGATTLSAATDYIGHMVNDGVNLTVYLNGVQDGQVAFSGTPATAAAEWLLAARFDPGFGGDNAGNQFDGNISLFKVWPRALSAGEVQASCRDEWAGCPDTIDWLDAQGPQYLKKNLRFLLVH